MALKNAHIAAIAVLLVLVSFLGGLAYTLSGEKDALSSSLLESGRANANLSGQIQILNSKVSALYGENAKLASDNALAQKIIAQREADIAMLNSTIESQESSIQSLSGNINKTKAELDTFEKSLNESSAWFKTNADITNFDQYRSYLFRIEFSCVQLSGGYCNVKLACLPLVNDIYMGVTYQTDEETSNRTDKLQSLSEFYDNKGGDCEDYSLASKAELNYIKSYCAKAGKTKLSFEAAQENINGVYAVDVPQTWGYKNAKAYDLPQGYDKYFVLCGAFPSASGIPNAAAGVSGHCLLAFSRNGIAGSSDIYPAISDAILVEPQTGYYYAATAGDNVFLKPQDGQNYSENQLYTQPSFWAVITDDDYYLYAKSDDGIWKWSGYKDLYARAEQARAQLAAVSTD